MNGQMTVGSVIKFIMADLENLREFWRPKMETHSISEADVKIHVAKLDTLIDFWIRLNILNGASVDSQKCIKCDLKHGSPSKNGESMQSHVENGSQTEENSSDVEQNNSQTAQNIELAINNELEHFHESQVSTTEALETDPITSTSGRDFDDRNLPDNGEESAPQNPDSSLPPRRIQEISPIKVENEALPFTDDGPHQTELQVRSPFVYTPQNFEKTTSNNAEFVTIHSDFLKEEVVESSETAEKTQSSQKAQNPPRPLRKKINPIVILDKRMADRALNNSNHLINLQNDRSPDATMSDWADGTMRFDETECEDALEKCRQYLLERLNSVTKKRGKKRKRKHESILGV